MIDIRTKIFRHACFALAFGSFLVFCNLYLFQALLPVMAERFDISATKANWLVAASTLSLAITLVPWAIGSELAGRYRVMISSLFLLPVIGLIVLVADSFLLIALSRALMGIALAGFAAVAVAYMAEEFTTRALVIAVGFYISANSLGGITGRIFGGVVTDYRDWQTAVMGMAFISLAGAILVFYLLPKPQYFTPSTGHSFKYHSNNVLIHLKRKRLWFAMLIGGINFGLFMNFYSVMGFRLVAPPYELAVSWASLIFLCYLAGAVSAQFSGWWPQSRGTIQGIVLGNTISLLGALIATYESLSTIIAGLLLISAGSFFTHSLAYGWVSQKAETARASATALYLVHYYTGGSIGGFILMACWESGGRYGVLAGASFFYLLIFILATRLSRYQVFEGESAAPVQSETD